jgi:hypothetical protein
MQHLQFASFYCPCWLVQTRLDMYSVLHNSCIFMDQYGRIQRTKTHFPKKPIHVECCWTENLMVLNHVKPTITHHFLWKFTIRTVLKTTMVVAYWVILLPCAGNLNGFVRLYCQIIFRRTDFHYCIQQTTSSWVKLWQFLMVLRPVALDLLWVGDLAQNVPVGNPLLGESTGNILQFLGVP